MKKSIPPRFHSANTRGTPLELAMQWSADLSRRAALLWLFGIWASVGLADASTGPHVSFNSLYVLPLSLTTWCLGRAAGLGSGALAVAFTLMTNGFGDGLSAQSTSVPAGVAIWNAGMRLFGVIFLILLVSAFRRTFDRERFNARVDPLTGLGNRRAFEIESHKLSLACARDRRTILCGLIDLDDFKATNDHFGHADGDALLQGIAVALAASVRPYDVTARLGGDEFAFCLAVRDEAAAEKKADDIHRRLSLALAEIRPGSTCSLGATAGLDVERAMKAADEAMYRAKRGGKGSWIFVSSHHNAAAADVAAPHTL